MGRKEIKGNPWQWLTLVIQGSDMAPDRVQRYRKKSGKRTLGIRMGLSELKSSLRLISNTCVDWLICKLVVSSLRHIPKPGYGLAPRSHTFSSTGGSVSALPVSLAPQVTIDDATCTAALIVQIIHTYIYIYRRKSTYW